MEDKIKTIFQAKCPDCGKEHFIELIYTNPTIGKIFTSSEKDEAKKIAKEKISLSKISDSVKVKYIEWIDDETTVFSLEEVDLIIKTAELEEK